MLQLVHPAFVKRLLASSPRQVARSLLVGSKLGICQDATREVGALLRRRAFTSTWNISCVSPPCGRFHFRFPLGVIVRQLQTNTQKEEEEGDKKRAASSTSDADETYERAIKNASAKANSSMKGVKLAMAGNLVITTAKFMSWKYSGSSAMLSEAIHSLVDTGNQGLLLIGLNAARNIPDNRHQYGYGKAVYFWSLVSALGTFWLGAGICLRNSLEDLFYSHGLDAHAIGPDVWAVLGLSLVIDGYVFARTLRALEAARPPGRGRLAHLRAVRDPTRMAILLEDGAACLGVLIAIGGIGLSKYTGSPTWDAAAGVSISLLLAGMGTVLARINEKYLIGQAVEPEITKDIDAILLAQPSIAGISFVQSQWISPYTFAYKAEVDFDGTYLAARLLDRYEAEFRQADLGGTDLPVLLAWYAEDVMRVVEREVRQVEARIRERHPEAAFIELEPDSGDADALAIDLAGGAAARGPHGGGPLLDPQARREIWRLEKETIEQMKLDMNMIVTPPPVSPPSLSPLAATKPPRNSAAAYHRKNTSSSSNDNSNSCHHRRCVEGADSSSEESVVILSPPPKKK